LRKSGVVVLNVIDIRIEHSVRNIVTPRQKFLPSKNFHFRLARHLAE